MGSFRPGIGPLRPKTFHIWHGAFEAWKENIFTECLQNRLSIRYFWLRKGCQEQRGGYLSPVSSSLTAPLRAYPYLSLGDGCSTRCRDRSVRVLSRQRSPGDATVSLQSRWLGTRAPQATALFTVDTAEQWWDRAMPLPFHCSCIEFCCLGRRNT